MEAIFSKRVRQLTIVMVIVLLGNLIILGANAYVTLAAPLLQSAGFTGPTTIAFEGYLADSGGSPTSGTHDLTFRLYPDATGGTALWEEDHASVNVSSGIYIVHLGSVIPLPTAAFDGDRWLSIEVDNSGTEMSPRIPITAVPWALNASQAYGIQGRPVDSATPTDGQVLLYDETAGKWMPDNLPLGADVQVFDSPGTDNWDKPEGVTTVMVIAIGGGGGGGGGVGSTNGSRPGGTGGGGASVVQRTFAGTALHELPTSISITVGAGGAGGAGGSGGSGTAGGAGGYSSFYSSSGPLLTAWGGGGGIGGTSGSSTVHTGGAGGGLTSVGGNGAAGTASTGGGPAGTTGAATAFAGAGCPATAGAAGGAAIYGGGAGGTTQRNTNGGAGGDSLFSAGGGGGGGSVYSTNLRDPGAGGGTGTYASGGGGAAGTSGSLPGSAGAAPIWYSPGTGGGGGYISTSGTGGDGGAGGNAGGGGGGGGSGTVAGGSGGAGGNGLVIVISW